VNTNSKRPPNGRSGRKGAAKLSSFVGRSQELRELRALLNGAERVVVVCGPRGVGKTRLVGEATKKLGALWLNVADLRSLDGLAARLAEALGIPLGSARSEDDRLRQLGRALAAGTESVVVIDGADTLGDKLWTAMQVWLSVSPKLQFVVTARDGLQSAGVHYALGPLTSRRKGVHPGVQLFLERCRQLGTPTAAPEAADPLLEQLVRALEGMPLAIEIAATRYDKLGLRGLTEPLSDRGMSIQAAIKWSWDGLSFDLQSALAGLAVFGGSFTLDAAEAVLCLSEPDQVGERIGLLEAEALLVRATQGETGERISLDESVRSFAMERLAESGELEEATLRHDSYFLELGKLLLERVERYGDIHARAQLASELENFLAVHERALLSDNYPQALTSLLIADAVLATQVSAQVRLDLWSALQRRYGHELSSEIELRAGVGRALSEAGRLEEARPHLDCAAHLAEQRGSGRAAHLFVDLGLVFHHTGRLQEARETYARALELEAGQPDERLRARAWGNLGAVLHDERKFDGARRNYERSLAHARNVGDARIEGVMLTNLGVLEQELEELDRAGECFEGAMRLLEQAADRRLTAIAKSNLMTLLMETGDLEGARFYGEAALSEQRAMGDLKSLILVRARLAALYSLLEDKRRATLELEEAGRLTAELRDESAAAVLEVASQFLALCDAASPQSVLANVQAAAAGLRSDGLAKGDRSDEVRTLVRIAEKFVKKHKPGVEQATSPDALLVSPDATFLRPPRRKWMQLEMKSPAQRIFAALLEHRTVDPELGLSMDQLASAGWPDVELPTPVRASRVYAAIAVLRRSGLESLVVRRPGGYLLDPELRVIQAAPKAEERAALLAPKRRKSLHTP
jgi:predicted ATPase